MAWEERGADSKEGLENWKQKISVEGGAYFWVIIFLQITGL